MYETPRQGANPAEDYVRIADWIELNLVTARASVVSITDVAAAVASVPPDDSQVSQHRQDYSEYSEDDDPLETQPGYWQQAEEAAEMAFRELGERALAWGERYLLRLSGDIVEANNSGRSQAIATFLTLLRSRHLYYAALGDNGEVSGELFEELLPHALRKFLGTEDEYAIRFGLAGGTRGGGLPRRIDQALDELALRMNEPRGDLRELDENEDYKGDAVAWKPFGDRERGKLAVVGQATIAEGKWNKQPSGKWKNGSLIGFLAPPATVVAFVETISLDSDSKIQALGDREYSSIPLDRLRLLSVLEDSDLPPSLLEQMRNWSEGMEERLPR